MSLRSNEKTLFVIFQYIQYVLSEFSLVQKYKWIRLNIHSVKLYSKYNEYIGIQRMMSLETLF